MDIPALRTLAAGRRSGAALPAWCTSALFGAILLLAAACSPPPEPEGVQEANADATDSSPEEKAQGSLEYPEWETLEPGDYAGYNQRASVLQRGHRVYLKYCVGCHGEYGNGNGVAAARLITQPRDFTSGIYKFRSTDSGSLPLEVDLHRTITRGLSRVSMPAFPLMPEPEKLAVIEYVKAFYPSWQEEAEDRRIVPVPLAPENLREDDRILRGRMVYLQMGCAKCHGYDGRGTGATQQEYVDAWGNPQRAFDFTRGELKGGSAPEDIYRTFHTGLRSIMPSFGGDTLAAVTADGFDAVAGPLEEGEAERLRGILNQFPPTAGAIFSDMSEGERLEVAQRHSWDLVSYILSLRTSTSTAEAVLGKSPSSADSPRSHS